MRIHSEGLTEAEALGKACLRDPSRLCVASRCMGWAFGVEPMLSRDEALPEDVAAAFNAANAAAAEGMDPDEGPALDPSPIAAWIEAVVAKLGEQGWTLRDGSTPEMELSDLYDLGTFENELEAGDIELTFEKPKPGVVRRGMCVWLNGRG